MDDVTFIKKLITHKLRAGNSFVIAVRRFLDNNMDANYDQLVNNLLDSYIVQTYLSLFPKNLGAVGEESLQFGTQDAGIQQ